MVCAIGGGGWRERAATAIPPEAGKESGSPGEENICVQWFPTPPHPSTYQSRPRKETGTEEADSPSP